VFSLCFGGCFPLQLSPSVLLYCWLGLLTCKNLVPDNLYCVGGDVKHCTTTTICWVNIGYSHIGCVCVEWSGLNFGTLSDTIIASQPT